MTLQELNAELRRVNMEVLVKTLTQWSDEETEPMIRGDRWCEGYAVGYNQARQLIKDLIENSNL
jgi:hypothetical protein